MRDDIRRSTSAVALVGLAAAFAAVADRPSDLERPTAAWENRSVVTLRGRHRAFEPGHSDFGLHAADGAGRYMRIVADELDPAGRPVFRSAGYRVESAFTDRAGNWMMPPRSYIASRPSDRAGALRPVQGHAVGGAASFSQWFRDTPAVNTGTPGTIMLARDSQTQTYRFNGPLGDGGSIGINGRAGDLADSTYELDTLFVYHEGDGWWLETETDADVWAFIGGRLVIDGGAGSGQRIEHGAPLDDFDIEEGTVVPGDEYAIEFRVLGAAIQNNSYHFPVTTSLQVGDQRFEPFGSDAHPATANVNDNQVITGWQNAGANPRRFAIPGTFPAGTPIDVTGISWRLEDSGSPHSNWAWKQHLSAQTSVASQQITVLRHGDPVPRITGAYEQRDVVGFLDGYVDSANGTIRLEANEVIYLFELGMPATSANADFQDLVVVVSLATDDNFYRPPTDPTEPTIVAEPAPNMRQRIDLDRLDWLEDGRTYPLRIFSADRDGVASDVRLETNISTLNIAASPTVASHRD